MKLIVGLGNPGLEYHNTRHNVGFMLLDYITNYAKFKLNKKFNAMEYETTVDNEKVIFIKPLSYMNLSGEVVEKYVNFYKVKLDDILVIQDDLDMAIGKYKLTFNHGDGGHNGIKNIILNLNSRLFLRLKIGISRPNIETKDYVLGKFNKGEIQSLEKTFSELESLIVDYIHMNRDLLMGKYNIKGKEIK